MSSMDELQQIINDLEEENKKLKEENEKLDTEKWKCIYQNIKLNTENKKIKKREEEDIREQKKQLDYLEQEIDEELIKLKCEVIYLKCMMKNMILSLFVADSDDLEFKIKSNYGMNYSDEYIKYKNTLMENQIKEMNDSDWNDDGESLKLEYEPTDEMVYVHFNDSDDSDDSE